MHVDQGCLSVMQLRSSPIYTHGDAHPVTCQLQTSAPVSVVEAAQAVLSRNLNINELIVLKL